MLPRIPSAARLARPAHRLRDAQSGQASVEFLALLPALLLICALCWQAVVAGQALWLAGSAARSAARAQALGGDPVAAARRVLPRRLAAGAKVTSASDGVVRVAISIPSLVGAVTLGTTSARAGFAPQR